LQTILRVSPSCIARVPSVSRPFSSAHNTMHARSRPGCVFLRQLRACIKEGVKTYFAIPVFGCGGWHVPTTTTHLQFRHYCFVGLMWRGYAFICMEYFQVIRQEKKEYCVNAAFARGGSILQRALKARAPIPLLSVTSESGLSEFNKLCMTFLCHSAIR
jgi:hypothetical protein